MNSSDRSNLTVESLLALRSEPDATRIITEKLRVKDMGPADHIRTKHEVRAFVESGNATAADLLLKRASERRKVENTQAETIAQSHRQRLI